MAAYHNDAEPFEDAENFMNYIDGKYTYCLSSDTDNDMITKNKFTQKSNMVFTSENLGTYKHFKENIFFRTVLDYYDYEPREIIHIGDSVSDVINPKQLGIKACWLNRNGSSWPHEIEPDFVCSGLDELKSVL